MSGQGLAYLGLGIALCVLLAAVALHYYSRKRKERVEQAKFRMMDDE